MNKRAIVRFFIGLTLGLTLAALVAFNALLVWVATGPRSLERFTPYMEKALTGESDVRAEIGQTWLLWGGWSKPLDLRLKQVSLLDAQGRVFSSFPEISLGLDVLSLPLGRVLPTSITVQDPVVNIPREALARLLDVSAEPHPQVESNADALSALIESLINPRSKSSLRRLQMVELIRADLRLSEGDKTLLYAPQSNVIIRKQSAREVKVTIRSLLHYADEETAVSGNFAFNKKRGRLEGALDVNMLMPSKLLPLFGDKPEFTALQFPVSGRIGFAFTKDGALDALRVAVEGGKGRISHPRLDGELPINRLRLSASASNGLREFDVQAIAAELSGSPMQGKFHISLTDAGIGLTGDAQITDVDTSDVKRFWPLGLAPLSREWVTTNINGGKVAKAAVEFAVKPGDLELPLLPKEAVDATIDLKDARIRYLPNHPEVRGVNAQVKVDGLSLSAAIAQAAAFSDSKLSNGRLLIADLNPDNPLIELSMEADAPASDIVTLLGLEPLSHAEHLNLNAKKVSGRATGSAKLGFYFFARDAQGNETPITYNIKGKTAAVSAPAFMGRFDIEQATGDLSIDEKEIVFSGAANVNGSRISQGNVSYALAATSDTDTKISAQGTISDDILKRFGVELPVSVGAERSVRFEAGLNTRGKATSIPRFSVKGEGLDVEGKAQLAPGGQDVQSVSLGKARLDKTQLSQVEYSRADGRMNLSLSGDALDVSRLFEQKGEGFSFTKFPALSAKLRVDKLYTLKGHSLEAFSATADCSALRCASASVKALAGGKPYSFEIRSSGKQRTLAAKAENAGALLSAFGIMESMQGGVLNLSGQFSETLQKSSLAGSLFINDYTLVDAPVLAKMLSLASLTGFFDTLSGKGIAFSKLKAPFTVEGDVITLKDAKTYGPAMGLSADGTITLPKTTLALEGNIVPSYTLNNVVGRVPVLGDILTGGEGQGVFAARYTMKGDSENPEVTVNPLSILTPGFLRNLFDAF